MPREIEPHPERVVAHIASIGFFAAVGLLVILQTVRCGEVFVANFALVFVLPCLMDQGMLEQTTGIAELPITQNTQLHRHLEKLNPIPGLHFLLFINIFWPHTAHAAGDVLWTR